MDIPPYGINYRQGTDLFRDVLIPDGIHVNQTSDEHNLNQSGGGLLRSGFAPASTGGYPDPLHDGRVPKWSKGTDCKSVIRGFESHRGLSPF